MAAIKNRTIGGLTCNYHKIARFYYDGKTALQLWVQSYVNSTHRNSEGAIAIGQEQCYNFAIDNVASSDQGWALAYAQLMAHEDFVGATSDEV